MSFARIPSGSELIMGLNTQRGTGTCTSSWISHWQMMHPMQAQVSVPCSTLHWTSKEGRHIVLAGEDTENSSTAPAPTREKPTVRIYERTRTGDDSVMKRNTVVNNLPPHEKERRRFVITRASTLEVLRRDSFLDARKPRRWFSFHNFDLMTTVVDGIKDVADTAAAAFGIPRCTSPMGQIPCDGWCQPTTRKKKAQVVRCGGDPL